MVDRIGNFLSPSQNSQVQAIKQTQRVVDDVQQQLASGKRVNSALDDPQNFFTAQSLQNRSNDLARLLDGIGQGIRTIETANTGLSAIEIF